MGIFDFLKKKKDSEKEISKDKYDENIEFENIGMDSGQKHREININDMYDVAKILVDVHTPNSLFNRDYSLTDYSKDITNEKIPKFIRRQFKIILYINQVFITEKEELFRIIVQKKGMFDRKGNLSNTKELLQETEICYTEIEKNYKKVETLLRGDVDNLIIPAKNFHAEIRDSMISLIRGGSGMGDDDIPRAHSIPEKLMQKRREKVR